jgi:hypothetical protein
MQMMVAYSLLSNAPNVSGVASGGDARPSQRLREKSRQLRTCTQRSASNDRAEDIDSWYRVSMVMVKCLLFPEGSSSKITAKPHFSLNLTRSVTAARLDVAIFNQIPLMVDMINILFHKVEPRHAQGLLLSCETPRIRLHPALFDQRRFNSRYTTIPQSRREASNQVDGQRLGSSRHCDDQMRTVHAVHEFPDIRYPEN